MRLPFEITSGAATPVGRLVADAPGIRTARRRGVLPAGGFQRHSVGCMQPVEAIALTD